MNELLLYKYIGSLITLLFTKLYEGKISLQYIRTHHVGWWHGERRYMNTWPLYAQITEISSCLSPSDNNHFDNATTMCASCSLAGLLPSFSSCSWSQKYIVDFMHSAGWFLWPFTAFILVLRFGYIGKTMPRNSSLIRDWRPNAWYGKLFTTSLSSMEIPRLWLKVLVHNNRWVRISWKETNVYGW